MKTKEKRTKTTVTAAKPQTKINISQKTLNKIWQHKSGANTLTKLIRLMEIFKRHT